MYVYCKNCDWSQDDFHNEHYNLITKIKTLISWLIKPQFLSLDKNTSEEVIKNAKIIVLYGFNFEKVFSWTWLIVELKILIKNYFDMKWKTYAEYQDSDKKCPKCGSILTID